MTSQYHNFLCNGATFPKKKGRHAADPDDFKRLNYDTQQQPNIIISLHDFRRDLTHISPRVIDLLEIAAYTFCGDRLTSRGSPYQEHHDGWSRKLKFIIQVRDVDFWSGPVKETMSRLLEFVTGDAEIVYEFQAKEESDGLSSLFDGNEFIFPAENKTSVALFSGGLDSLAGAIDILENTTDDLCLVSHDSGNPGTHKTQNSLVEALQNSYGKDRISRYPFTCRLKTSENKATEETQRSRIFLYSSIAFALTTVHGLSSFYIFENGVTSLNFPKRQDMNKGRASRTTHPKTVHILEELFAAISCSKFSIETPFKAKTKADVIKSILNSNHPHLISSSVSCAHTRANSRTAPQCGYCNQCVDRRIAAFAAGAHEEDHYGLYEKDFLSTPLNQEGTTNVIDYFSFMAQIQKMSLESFYFSFPNELAEILEHVPADGHNEQIEEIYKLLSAHSQMVVDAYTNMCKFSNRIGKKRVEGTIFDLIEKDQHLKSGIALVAGQIADKLRRSVPIMFNSNPPSNENALNDYIQSILAAENYFGFDYTRESSAGKFILSQSIPDHIFAYNELFIETKLIKAKGSPSKFEEQIAADMTKYRANNSRTYLLFVVYDVGKRILDYRQWCDKLEEMGDNIKVCVIK